MKQLVKVGSWHWIDLLARAAVAAGVASALTACGGGGGGSEAPSPPPVVTPALPPSITAQPLAVTVVDGGSATFTVTAVGTALTYQWQRDGNSIAGATGASYVIPAVHYADSGASYQVVVSGASTSVTSASVALTVTPIALSLTAQPQPQSAKDGDVVSFDVKATGSEPIKYQWLRNGVAIVGADKPTYTTSALTVSDDAAVFKAVLTNPAGTLTTQEAKLSVAAVPPRIVSAPESVTTTDGATVTFKVVAAGTAPLTYQWLRNDKPIAGATSDSYSATLAYSGSGDRYAVQIGNGVGQITSAAAVATVNALAPSISQQPSDVVATTGDTAKFAVSAGGTGPLRYQWQQSRDGGLTWSAISGATASTYTVSNATLADTASRVRVTVSNALATLNSNPANLTVRANVRILAGTTGGSGYADGQGSTARFDFGNGLAADASGNVYVLESNNSVIRRVSPDGKTSLFAGQPKTPGRVNGTLAEARFTYPSDLAINQDGTMYVAESCTIRKITSAGIVTDFVGSSANCSTKDGTGDRAGFNQIVSLALDGDGNLFVAERTGTSGQLIRKVTAAGVVTSIAGSATESGKVDGVGAAARFNSIGRMAVDRDKNVYVADGSAIRQVTPKGEVSYYAGAPDTYSPIEGYRTSARFGYILSLAFDGAGNLFVGEWARISRVSTAGNVVAAVVGIPGNGGYPISRDGSSQTASIGNATVMTSLPNGSMAFFDGVVMTVRTLSPTANVTTLAGGGQHYGFADGTGAAARFAFYNGYTLGLSSSPTGNLIVTDPGNFRIRQLALGTNQVVTLAGSSSIGSQDGPLASATFANPAGVTTDPAGNLYLTDAGYSTIRRISVAGIVSLVAGKAGDHGSADGSASGARFSNPQAVVMDSKGNLFVADAGNSVIRRVAPDGSVTTVAGKAGQSGYVNGSGAEARLGFIRYMAIDKDDNVYFTDYSNSIRRMTPNGEVSTYAGAPFSAGSIDDVAQFARFTLPAGLAFDARGNLYVADTGNSAIRRITPDGQVSTVIGVAGLAALRPGVNGAINQPSGIAVTPAGRLVFISEGAIVGD